VDKVRAATEMWEKRPDLKIEGPIQYDAAVDMEVGQSKTNSEVAGQAVYFFLNTGNNTYKRFKEKREHWPMLIARVEQTRKRFKPRMYGRWLLIQVITAIQAQGLKKKIQVLISSKIVNTKK
jgi:phosphate acetyltransferase